MHQLLKLTHLSLLNKTNWSHWMQSSIRFKCALPNQKDITPMRDLAEEDPTEVEAGNYNLNYIKLDGNVGCMVNGAGLAMATMDIIKLQGGEPANFLDVGGGANVETVKNGFKIILSDKNVKAVLINIFGGIVRCDRVANGIIEAVKDLDLNVPVVVRLEGTNADVAKDLLANANLDIIPATSLADAAANIICSYRRKLMSILINKDSKIIVQGITGSEGSFHAEQCYEYGKMWLVV